MAHTISRQKVHAACVQKQEELIRNFEERVAEMKDDIFSQDHSASQTENRQAGKMEVMHTLEKELDFARMEMSFLSSLKPEQQHSIAEPGALVETDKRTFYIAVSSEGITVDGNEVFGISTRAPLYKMMAGKTKGESFAFNETTYTIRDIY